MKKPIILLLFISIAFSCERDDICPESTPTTPRLVMDFVDLLNTDNAKSVNDFRVADAFDTTRFLNETGDASSIILPLKTTEDMTQFIFYKDYEIDDNSTPDDASDDIQLGNPDMVTITYLREQVYVSRACGYKTIFTNVQVSVETTIDIDNWIQFIQPLNDNQFIADETTTHFNLLH